MTMINRTSRLCTPSLPMWGATEEGWDSYTLQQVSLYPVATIVDIILLVQSKHSMQAASRHRHSTGGSVTQ